VTKVGALRDAQGGWPQALAPEHLRQAVHDNLHNLGFKTVDVVNLRVGGQGSPAPGSIADPFTVLAQLRQGLIKHLGLSTVSAEQIAEAQSIAPIACVQNFYNLAHRADDDLIDSLGLQRVAYVPYFPLGGSSPLQSMNSVAAALAAESPAICRYERLAAPARRASDSRCLKKMFLNAFTSMASGMCRSSSSLEVSVLLSRSRMCRHARPVVAHVGDRLPGQWRGGQVGEGLDRHRDHDDVTGRRGLPARRRGCPRPSSAIVSASVSGPCELLSTTWCPASMASRAIAVPICPLPMNPTVVIFSASLPLDSHRCQVPDPLRSGVSAVGWRESNGSCPNRRAGRLRGFPAEGPAR
jgi:hypothetical protein